MSKKLWDSFAVIGGKRISLRPATANDRRMVYDWLVHSDCTVSFMGEPTYPDMPLPTWEEFCSDYKLYFFNGSLPGKGRSFIIMCDGVPAGHINYNDIDCETKRTELDIWMSSELYCGHGYGTYALQSLCGYLKNYHNVYEFVIRPSARNKRAIRAYTKAGFIVQKMTPEQQEKEYGPGDCYDSVVMVKK